MTKDEAHRSPACQPRPNDIGAFATWQVGSSWVVLGGQSNRSLIHKFWIENDLGSVSLASWELGGSRVKKRSRRGEGAETFDSTTNTRLQVSTPNGSLSPFPCSLWDRPNSQLDRIGRRKSFTSNS